MPEVAACAGVSKVVRSPSLSSPFPPGETQASAPSNAPALPVRKEEGEDSGETEEAVNIARYGAAAQSSTRRAEGGRGEQE
eukprot:746109-Hanusia_phi.AAC.1